MNEQRSPTGITPGRIAFMFAMGLGVVALWLAHRASIELHNYRSDDPTVWESQIAAFERRDRAEPPPQGAVLFVGSSSIRLWETLAQDMAPLPVIARGFGGAKISDILYYADRLILPHAPRAIVVFAGGNDLFSQAGNRPRSPEQVAESCRQLADRLRAALPPTPVYFIALRPPIRDPQGRDPFSRTNALVRKWADSQDGVAWIDANDGLYGPDRRLRPELLGSDRVHLTPAGYRAWATPIHERLVRDLARPAGEAAPGVPST